jgi:hypothetical protein
MRSLCIVETPLQMINAIEAKHSLDLGECFLVVLLSAPFPEQVFRPLLPLADWENVECHWLRHQFQPMDLRWLGKSLARQLNEYVKESKQLVRHIRFDKLSTKFGPVDNLVLGNLLQGYMQHLANRVKAKHIYLLDDGTDTLRVNEQRRSEEPDSTAVNRITLLRRAKNRLRRAYLDWDTKGVNSVTFFTSYNLDLDPRDRCVKNEYTYLRQRCKAIPVSGDVYFLGGALVEDGYLSQETHLDALTKIVKYYAGQNFLYVPHWREAKANIEIIRGLNIDVKRFNLPIEVQMATECMPGELASFFSSALDNSRIIFGPSVQVTAFHIDQKSFLPGCEFVEDVYEYFRTHSGPNFRVMNL